MKARRSDFGTPSWDEATQKSKQRRGRLGFISTADLAFVNRRQRIIGRCVLWPAPISRSGGFSLRFKSLGAQPAIPSETQATVTVNRTNSDSAKSKPSVWRSCPGFPSTKRHTAKFGSGAVAFEAQAAFAELMNSSIQGLYHTPNFGRREGKYLGKHFLGLRTWAGHFSACHQRAARLELRFCKDSIGSFESFSSETIAASALSGNFLGCVWVCFARWQFVGIRRRAFVCHSGSFFQQKQLPARPQRVGCSLSPDEL